MSRGFIKEGDQEEIPRVPMRAYLPDGVPNYVTKEGLEALKEELKGLEEERLKAGDNYIMVNFIDATIKLLVDRINNAVEVDLSKSKKDTVSFGAWVRYNGRVVRIVGVDEADVNKGLISFISPIAKLLMGKRVGDVIELKGEERIEVEEVSFEPMALTQIVHDKPAKTSTTTERRPRRIIEEQPQPGAQTQPIDENKTVAVTVKSDESHRVFAHCQRARQHRGKGYVCGVARRQQDAAPCSASACHEWRGRDHKALLVACGVWRHPGEDAQTEDGGNAGAIGSEPEVEASIYQGDQEREGVGLRLYGCFRRGFA